ncbi:MAG: NHL repeat-containing protein [Acidobacteria bacterium]|nr:NHL repeat-containing protein [Acidobacteriota bacterium]
MLNNTQFKPCVEGGVEATSSPSATRSSRVVQIFSLFTLVLLVCGIYALTAAPKSSAAARAKSKRMLAKAPRHTVALPQEEKKGANLSEDDNERSTPIIPISGTYRGFSSTGPFVYVADTTNNRIQRFDGICWETLGYGVGSAPGQFRGPEAVVSEEDYYYKGLCCSAPIYVADTLNNRIQWSTDGGICWDVFASVGSGLNQVRAPQGLAIDNEGNLIVADTGNGRILRFEDGIPGFAVLLASKGSGSGQVGSPFGLAMDFYEGDTLYVCDQLNSRVLRIDDVDDVNIRDTGVIVASMGVGLNKVKNPQGICVDFDGTVYVADSGNNRVLRWINGNPNNSTALAQIGTGLGQVNRPEGVTISYGFYSEPWRKQLESGPMLVVSDTGNNRVQARPLDSPGQWDLVGYPNGSGTQIGQFRFPSKIHYSSPPFFD